MTTPTIAQIEQGFISRLETLKMPAAGGIFRQVSTHQGTELARLARGEGFDSPSCWVHLEELQDERKGMKRYTRDCVFGVFVAVLNYRGDQERRQGVASPAEVGVYECLDAVRDLLVGHRLGLSIKPLLSAGAHSLVPPEKAWTRPVSVYRYDWIVSYDWCEPERPGTEDFHETSSLAIDAPGGESPELTQQVTHT